MKIVVFGKNGMLGRYVYSFLKSEGFDVVGITRKDINNITLLNQVELEYALHQLGLEENDVVINCIGLIKQRQNVTTLDFIQVNSTFPLMLSNVCEDKNVRLIHPTTDCFVPDTKILTNNGYFNIEDLYVDDLVYTHTGELKRVVDVLVKNIDEEIYEIKTLGNDPVVCTHNHPWYGIKRQPKDDVILSNINWLKTDEMCVGSLISIPKMLLKEQTIFSINLLDFSDEYKKIYEEYNYFLNNIKPYNINIKKYCKENNLNYRKIINWNKNEKIKPKICKFNNILNINNDLMWLLGIFLAEGWVDNQTGRKTITLSFGDETDLITKVVDVITKELNIIPNIRKMKNQKGYQINFTHQLLCEFLSKDFYIKNKHYSHTKGIPQWIKNTGKENILSFIKGYFDGDGCFYENEKTNFISISSVSEKIVDDLKILFMGLGFLPNKSIIKKNKKENIMGRMVNAKNKHTLTISGKQIKELLIYFNIKNKNKNKRYNKFFEDDKNWYVPITRITKIKYSGVVYNLEVEDEHSYLVNGGLSAHNCVYDGLDGAYDENFEHNATDIYGTTKSLGEPKDATIIRTSIIGEELRNFSSLLEWAKSNKNKEVNGYTNHVWNGITCLQFAKICKDIIVNNKYWTGVRHLFSPDTFNKFELVKLISDVYNLNINVTTYRTDIMCDRSLTSCYEDIKFEIPDLKTQLIEMIQFYSKLTI